MNLPFFIARRYLVKQKGTFSSFIIRLSIAATALSVAAMIMALAFITGFKHTIREKLYSFLGHIHIELFNPNRAQSLTLNPIKWDPALVATLKGVPHVKEVMPFAQRPTIIHANGQMEGIFLKGVNDNYSFSKEISFKGHKINYSDTAYARQVILSQSTADRLNVSIGDTVQLYFLEQGITFPRIRKVQVAGLFHTGMEDIDKSYALGDMRLLQRVNNWRPNEISGYQLELDNEKYSDTTANLIYDKYLKPPMTSYTMRDIYTSVYDWLDLTDINSNIFIIIMGIVAIINLASALMILIVEQARMVGLLKAMGMAAAKTQEIFLYHAAIIAGIGVLAGNVLAGLICWLQLRTGFMKLSEDTYSMKEVPILIHWWQIALVDVATMLLCILCMWLPTLYIRRVRPAQVLQFK